MRLRDHDDDPDAPASEDERRAATALRRALGADSANSPIPSSAASQTASSASSPQRITPGDGLIVPAGSVGVPSATSPAPVAPSNEARWLSAHLRYPKPEDSLGEVKARRLARMAQEVVHQRRLRSAQRASSWVRIGRSMSSTAGLLGAAGLLLLVSWLILDQGDQRKQARVESGSVRVSRVVPPSARVTSALLLRQSLAKQEDPAARLDLMIQRRLNELRGSTPDPLPSGRGLAVAGWPVATLRGAP